MIVEIFAVKKEQSMYKRDCLKGQGQVKVGNSAWAHQVRKASPGSMHSSYIVLPHKEFQFVFFFSNIALCLSEKSQWKQTLKEICILHMGSFRHELFTFMSDSFMIFKWLELKSVLAGHRTQNCLIAMILIELQPQLLWNN